MALSEEEKEARKAKRQQENQLKKEAKAKEKAAKRLPIETQLAAMTFTNAKKVTTEAIPTHYSRNKNGTAVLYANDGKLARIVSKAVASSLEKPAT
jgi:hypothetical protein